MSGISKKIVDAVKNHLDEYSGGDSVHISMEGDLESEIDQILLDAIFPVDTDGE